MKKMMKFNLAIMVLPLWFISCNNTSIRGTSLPSEITREIEGEYAFAYNTGQIEVLKMNLDSSYSKVVYPDTTSYKEKKDTLFYNKGRWDVEENRIMFYDWLWCNDDMNKNNILMKPYETIVGSVSWREPEGNKPASILLFDEPYYEFLRVNTDSK
jgi:hypothetical protein